MIEVLKQIAERIDRARNILTDGAPSSVNNWGMLDTSDLRQAIAELENQEPVAWLCTPDENGVFGLPLSDFCCIDCFPVYRDPPAQPPQRKEHCVSTKPVKK